MGVNASSQSPRDEAEFVPDSGFSIMRFMLLPLVAAAVIVADQLTKAWVIQSLSNGRIIDVLGGIAQLDFTQNTGAAFGMFRQGSIVFAVIAVVVAATILVNFRRIARSPWPVRLALGLVLGGAVGNLVDRIRLGYVVDFIDLRWWPVFNLADSAIVVGVVTLVLWAFLVPQERHLP